MSLTIYNSLGRQKEEFKSIHDKIVTMHVCGPTVYDLLHVGNFRGAIFFNCVKLWLEHLGYEVRYSYNYTDIDDKIINRAKEDGISTSELSGKYIKEFQKDFAALKLSSHTFNPKATEYIDPMIKMVQALIDKDMAYEVHGEVFFSVKKFENYGKLSGEKIELLEEGHRVETNPNKKDALDFVLWKPSVDDEPGWDSPWGRGRPGWHLECSTMVNTIFGNTIDIHGGGIDLTFPHHENEIAQSEAVTGKPFVRYWMHNNFIQFGDEKMSKSLGNVVKARDFLEKYNAEILKFMMLSSHYRSKLNFTEEIVIQNISGLSRIYAAVKMAESISGGHQNENLDAEFSSVLKKCSEEFDRSMNDDFNTPSALAAIFEVVRAFNASYQHGKKLTGIERVRAKAFIDWILSHGKCLSLFQEPSAEFLKELDFIFIRENGLDVKKIEELVTDRRKARVEKNYQRSDEIRDELSAMGIILHDAPDQTTWEVKRS